MPGSSVFNNGENGFSVLDRFPLELLKGESLVHRLMHFYAHTCNYVHASCLVVKGFHKQHRRTVGMRSRLRKTCIAAAFRTRHLLKLRGAIVPRRVRWGGTTAARASANVSMRHFSRDAICLERPPRTGRSRSHRMHPKACFCCIRQKSQQPTIPIL